MVERWARTVQRVSKRGFRAYTFRSSSLASLLRISTLLADSWKSFPTSWAISRPPQAFEENGREGFAGG